MKNLFLIRHAKSSWKETGLKDFDRPLNKRGKENLKMMSKFFADKFPKPDLILSSPAERAKQTAIAFAEKLDYAFSNIKFIDDLYMASDDEIKEVISALNEEIRSLIVFGHNPGLTDFVNSYSQSYLDNIPTCGIVKLETDKKWSEIKAKCFLLQDFLYPKMFLESDD